MSEKLLLGSLYVVMVVAPSTACSEGAAPATRAHGNGGRVDLKSTEIVSTPKSDLDGGSGAIAQDAARVTVTMCKNPTLGSVGSLDFVSLTGTAVNGCLGGDRSHCASSPAFVDPGDVALDYGNFPFSRDVAGQYFYAVVAEGFEDAGFFQGAVGNLSDDVPSAVAGDRGSGDSLRDRTIVVTLDPPKLFPASHGTHAFSFPPSQFMTIHLAPFDTTPEGHYVLVICPTTATSRCDCAFDAFTVLRHEADGGAGGSSGTGGAAGSGGNGGAAGRAGGSGGGSAQGSGGTAGGSGGFGAGGARDASVPDAPGSSDGSGHAMCPDM